MVKRSASQSLAKEEALGSNECTGEWASGAQRADGATRQLCPARVHGWSPRFGASTRSWEGVSNIRKEKRSGPLLLKFICTKLPASEKVLWEGWSLIQLHSHSYVRAGAPATNLRLYLWSREITWPSLMPFFVCLFDSTWMWECEKKDLDLSRICNGRTVVPQYHTLHTWIAASLSPVLFGSIRLYRRRDLSTLMTALYLLPRKEAPRTRRVQIHQTFLKKYRTLFYALLTLVCLQCTCQQMCETQSLRKKVNHYGQISQFNLINTYWVFFTKLLRT